MRGWTGERSAIYGRRHKGAGDKAPSASKDRGWRPGDKRQTMMSMWWVWVVASAGPYNRSPSTQEAEAGKLLEPSCLRPT